MFLIVATTGFFLALIISVIATRAVRSIAITRGWLDSPDGVRKVHGRAIPSAGGVGIAIGAATAVGILAVIDHIWLGFVAFPPVAFWMGGLVILAAGIIDDVRGLGFKRKFVVQAMVAYILLLSGLRIDVSALPYIGDDAYIAAMVSIPLTMLWIVGIINAVNLLDGLDGLAAGVCFIAFGSLALIVGLQGQPSLSLVALCVSGALLGFLVYNFNPASIFMGDSGSLLLGYLLAVMSLQGWGHQEPGLAWLVPVLLLGLPLLDTGLSILRRLHARRAIFAPDRDHIHHRLARRYPHRQAVIILWGAALVFGIAAIGVSLLPAFQAGGMILMVGLLAGLCVYQLGYPFPTEDKPDEVGAEPRPAPPTAGLDLEPPGGDGIAQAGLPKTSPVLVANDTNGDSSAHASRHVPRPVWR
jgi:UDP-GlcNAc:undecaprenyl-phosphate/decaprenyl-phosphate GlcNAc-1-phosphate transferase